MADRCSGNCCREFTLTGHGSTPDEIRAFLRERALDGVQIADMVVPLRAIEVGTILPNGGTCSDPPLGGGWIFTCRHFDPATKNCGIYAERPRMCRDFPYGHPCEHGEACSWDTGRAGHWPVHFEHTEYQAVDLGELRALSRRHLDVLQPTGATSQQRALKSPVVDVSVGGKVTA